MKCNLCQIESNLENHIGPTWYCHECSDKSFFRKLKDIYNNEKGKKILYVSSSVQRLDEVSAFVIGGFDLFNHTNSIILIHSEGLSNLKYPVDVVFFDSDEITHDYLPIINAQSTTDWVEVDYKSWNLTNDNRSIQT